MTWRLMVTSTEQGTVIRVDGRLRTDGVAELERVMQAADRPVVLDLSNLTSADDIGLATLRRLRAEGSRLVGASPYVGLLLAEGVKGGRTEPHDRRPHR